MLNESSVNKAFSNNSNMDRNETDNSVLSMKRVVVAFEKVIIVLLHVFDRNGPSPTATSLLTHPTCSLTNICINRHAHTTKN